MLGEHAGAHVFTVGQRHGLGIGGTDPLYVLGTDTLANTVTVGARDELLVQGVAVREATLHRDGGVRRRRARALARAPARLPPERASRALDATPA